MNRRLLWLVILLNASAAIYAVEKNSTITPVVKTPEELKKQLSDEQYDICFRKGTERPFSGAYWNNHDKGTYYCVVCGLDLFKSDTKFDSGTGWPSFWNPATNSHLKTETDQSHGMTRTEVMCARCGAHLGHLFEDGPKPSGLRYCINSAALRFEKDPAAK